MDYFTKKTNGVTTAIGVKGRTSARDLELMIGEGLVIAGLPATRSLEGLGRRENGIVWYAVERATVVA